MVDLSPPVMAGTHGRCYASIRMSNVVVAGGGKLRYTPQVRGSQRSHGFPPGEREPLWPADAVVQRRYSLSIDSEEARKCWLV
jgi:hypothetical protein